jgi:predicted ribosomally synthesized peptide with nif11-like leader
MALENAKKFLEELRTNDKVKELLKGKEAPKSIEEAVNVYLGVAKELGFNLTGEDLLSAIKEAAIGQGTEEKELNPNEMEQVNGGWDLLKWVEVNISLPILEKTNEIRKNLNVDTVTDTLKDKMKEVVDKVTGN